MYISDLEIKGFKSFAEPTKLKFSEGLTCIVGPNGCGKTNVVDAIRWVMGEQKSSVLRSQNMHDVIFSGTSKRKPVNYAEVSLTIHNDRGLLPVEYTDVVITRRVFRDGASEFFINKNACRLKDIHNLFVDTGMGSDAYSVSNSKWWNPFSVIARKNVVVSLRKLQGLINTNSSAACPCDVSIPQTLI